MTTVINAVKSNVQEALKKQAQQIVAKSPVKVAELPATTSADSASWLMAIFWGVLASFVPIISPMIFTWIPIFLIIYFRYRQIHKVTAWFDKYVALRAYLLTALIFVIPMTILAKVGISML